MLADLRNLMRSNPEGLARDGVGLAALMVVILAAFFLPGHG